MNEFKIENFNIYNLMTWKPAFDDQGVDDANKPSPGFLTAPLGTLWRQEFRLGELNQDMQDLFVPIINQGIEKLNLKRKNVDSSRFVIETAILKSLDTVSNESVVGLNLMFFENGKISDRHYYLRLTHSENDGIVDIDIDNNSYTLNSSNLDFANNFIINKRKLYPLESVQTDLTVIISGESTATDKIVTVPSDGSFIAIGENEIPDSNVGGEVYQAILFNNDEGQILHLFGDINVGYTQYHLGQKDFIVRKKDLTDYEVEADYSDDQGNGTSDKVAFTQGGSMARAFIGQKTGESHKSIYLVLGQDESEEFHKLKDLPERASIGGLKIKFSHDEKFIELFAESHIGFSTFSLETKEFKENLNGDFFDLLETDAVAGDEDFYYGKGGQLAFSSDGSMAVRLTALRKNREKRGLSIHRFSNDNHQFFEITTLPADSKIVFSTDDTEIKTFSLNAYLGYCKYNIEKKVFTAKVDASIDSKWGSLEYSTAEVSLSVQSPSTPFKVIEARAPYKGGDVIFITKDGKTIALEGEFGTNEPNVNSLNIEEKENGQIDLHIFSMNEHIGYAKKTLYHPGEADFDFDLDTYKITKKIDESVDSAYHSSIYAADTYAVSNDGQKRVRVPYYGDVFFLEDSGVTTKVWGKFQKSPAYVQKVQFSQDDSKILFYSSTASVGLAIYDINSGAMTLKYDTQQESSLASATYYMSSFFSKDKSLEVRAPSGNDFFAIIENGTEKYYKNVFQRENAMASGGYFSNDNKQIYFFAYSADTNTGGLNIWDRETETMSFQQDRDLLPKEGFHVPEVGFGDDRGKEPEQHWNKSCDLDNGRIKIQSFTYYAYFNDDAYTTNFNGLIIEVDGKKSLIITKIYIPNQILHAELSEDKKSCFLYSTGFDESFNRLGKIKVDLEAMTIVETQCDKSIDANLNNIHYFCSSSKLPVVYSPDGKKLTFLNGAKGVIYDGVFYEIFANIASGKSSDPSIVEAVFSNGGQEICFAITRSDYRGVAHITVESMLNGGQAVLTALDRSKTYKPGFAGFANSKQEQTMTANVIIEKE